MKKMSSKFRWHFYGRHCKHFPKHNTYAINTVYCTKIQIIVIYIFPHFYNIEDKGFFDKTVKDYTQMINWFYKFNDFMLHKRRFDLSKASMFSILWNITEYRIYYNQIIFYLKKTLFLNKSIVELNFYFWNNKYV